MGVGLVSSVHLLYASTQLQGGEYETVYRKIENSQTTKTNERNKIHYLGKWTSANADDCSNHDENYSNSGVWGLDTVSPAYTLHFKGTEISLYGNKAPAIGKSKVFIDDKEVGTYNGENNKRITQQLLYKIDGLENKDHTLRVVDMKSGGSLQGIHLDYILVKELQDTVEKPITNIPEQLTLSIGERQTIQPQFKDQTYTLLWESGDKNVVQVQNHTITAVGEGSAQVMITCEENGITTVISVTVNKTVESRVE